LEPQKVRKPRATEVGFFLYVVRQLTQDA